MTYSLDFRRHILSDKRKYQLSYAATAKHFEVGKASLVRWSKRLMPQLKRNKPATKIDMKRLAQDVSDTGIFYALKQKLFENENNVPCMNCFKKL